MLALIAASLVPDAAGATRCLIPPVEYDMFSLTVESVTLDGVAVTDLEPWRQQARVLQADGDGLVTIGGDHGAEGFRRVP